MSEDAARVGVVGAERSAVDAPPGVTLTGDSAGVDAVVAVGESALLDSRSADAPILPVDAGAGVRSVPRGDLPAALSSVAAGDWSRWTTTALSVSVGGDHVTEALFDAMVVTEAPAHISEFTVETPRDRLGQFRADGVLLASAPGTAGYAKRVDAPVFEPELPVGAVVPVAPFATRLDHWVVDTDRDPVLTVTVERDEAAVELLADDRTLGEIPPRTPLTVSPGRRWTFCRVPESRSAFESPDGR
jgi:NAD+ kinase